jgi:ankyrin repeat protein
MTRSRSAAGIVLLTLLAGCSAAPTSPSLPSSSIDSAAASTPVSPATRPAAASTALTPPATTAEPATSTPAPAPAPTTPEAPPVPIRNPALDGQLIDAAWANDVGLATQLIAAGADVNAKDSTVQSAYLISTSEGYLDLLELTLAHGADVASLDSYNGTGLIRAAERGHADVVGRLLRAGIDVNHVNRLGWTALDEAIVYGDGGQGYVDTVRALVAGGADVGRVAGDGRTPGQNASAGGHDVIADTLQAAIDAAISSTDAAAVLLSAAADGDPDRVALALRAGAPLESRDEKGRTALLLAATNDRLDVARLLVVLGADPDAQDDQQDSAWLVTGVTGSVAMLEALLPAHPDLTLRNRFGGVSVIPASERGHVDYVRRVVSTGIDVNHINDLGWTAMLEAIVYGDGSEPYQQIIDILLDAGADPTIADAAGLTPLQQAQNRGFTAIADRLQAAGG